jgi:hypothetical protein
MRLQLKASHDMVLAALTGVNSSLPVLEPA